jgi:enterochelin esterase-like enzyme
MTPPFSPRLEAFRRAAQTDLASATTHLLQDLRQARGPLVEPLGEGQVLVTFVWHGAAQRVSVRGAQIFPDLMVPSHPLTRLPGTEVWWVSTPARAAVTTVYQYLVDELAPSGPPDASGDPAAALRAQLPFMRADPFNPQRLYSQAALIAGAYDEPEERWECVLELPGTEPCPWFEERGAPSGTLTSHRLVSRVLGNERTVTVWTPAGFSPSGGAYPLCVMLDGECWPRVARLPLGLDNLVAAGRITPPVVAFVHNPASPTPVLSRTREAACNPATAQMLAEELLPLLRGLYPLTGDPARTVLAGNSFTGLSAAYTALLYPQAYGAVMASSGAFWWGYAHHPAASLLLGKDGEPEWLTREYAAAPRVPVRFWLDVGVLEAGTYVPWIPGVDPRACVRHLRTVLRAKGNEVHYHEAAGGHEFATFRRSVTQALRTLFPAGG